MGQAGCHNFFTEQIAPGSRGWPGSESQRVWKVGTAFPAPQAEEPPPTSGRSAAHSFPCSGTPRRTRASTLPPRTPRPAATYLGVPPAAGWTRGPGRPRCPRSSRLGEDDPQPRLVGFRVTSQRRAGPFPRARGGDQLPPGASPSSFSVSFLLPSSPSQSLLPSGLLPPLPLLFSPPSPSSGPLRPRLASHC